MLNYLYAHSLVFIAIFVVGLCAVVGLLGQWLVYRFIPLPLRLTHNQVLGFTSATCGLFYVVLLAFIASTVWISYDRADSAVNQEASLVGDLFQDVSMVSKQFEAQTSVILRDYAQHVVTQEWPKMARGERAGGEGWQLIRKFYTELTELTETHPVKIALIQEMITRVNHLYDIRRERLRSAAGASLNSAVWLVVLLGGLISIASCWLFGFENRWLHSLTTIMISMTFGLVLFLIVVFNCPFRGETQISADPFERIWKHMDRRINASQPTSLPQK
jgi:hypothetical protein